MHSAAESQSQLAGGSSAHPCSRAPRPTKGTRGRTIQHFLAGQQESRFPMEIPPRTPWHSPPGAQQLSPCSLLPANRTQVPPQANSQHTHKLTPYTGFHSKGNEQIHQLLPEPYQMLQGYRGNLPKTPPAASTVQQPHSNPALLHSCGAGSVTCWARTKKEQKGTTPNPTSILEKFFSIPGLHPSGLGFTHKVNKEKPTVHKQ